MTPSPPRRRASRGVRLYRFLLRLYPSRFRRRHEQDMLDLFVDLCEAERDRRGGLGVLLIAARAYLETPMRAWIAHRDQWRGDRRAREAHPESGHGGLGQRPRRARSLIEALSQDIRVGLRALRKSPAAVIITVISLGFGIGAVTTVFSITNGLLFHLPVGLTDPENLVTVYTSRDDGDVYGNSSFPDYLSVAEAVDAFEDVAAFGLRGFTLGGEVESEPVLAEEVTGNFFVVTGIRPVLGRAFLPDESEIGRVAQVAVISHYLWFRRFGGAPGVLGQTIRLNEKPFTVVGVAPEGIVSRMAPIRPDIWVPLGIPSTRSERRTEALAQRDSRHFVVLGRMREGLSLGQVQAQLSVLSENLHSEHSDLWNDDAGQARILTAVREQDSRINPRARRLLMGITGFFLGAAGLILLIACSNVATLFLARAGRRRQEMAIRVSIGASRRRLVSLLLTEGLIPGLVGGVVGVLLASYAAGAMESLSLPLNIPLNLDISMDYRVLSFAFVVSVGASLLFGLIPALDASKPDLVSSLKGGARGMRSLTKGFGLRRVGLRNLMVVVQCGASIVLVVGAALFLRTLQEATAMDLGLDPERVAVVTKSLPEAEYSPEVGLQYYRDLRSRLSALPGVVDAQLSQCLELTFYQMQCATEVEVVEGESAAAGSAEGEAPRYLRNAVTPGYLEMLQVPLLRGRTLRESDGPDAPLVAVVNETFAQRLWPGEDPLGRHFAVRQAEDPADEESPQERSFAVVGVTRDGKYEDFDDEATSYFWTSFYQDYAPSAAVTLKGAVSAEAMVPLLREHVDMEPGEVPLLGPTTLESQVSVQFLHLRIASKVLGWGGAFGLILAAIGIYGVVSVAVTERTREMAIRLAIGAERLQVIRGVAGGGMALAAVGLVIGLAVVLPLAHLLRSVLYGVGAVDLVALGGGIGILALSALVASVVPARRATRIDPMKILREE